MDGRQNNEVILDGNVLTCIIHITDQYDTRRAKSLMSALLKTEDEAARNRFASLDLLRLEWHAEFIW